MTIMRIRGQRITLLDCTAFLLAAIIVLFIVGDLTRSTSICVADARATHSRLSDIPGCVYYHAIDVDYRF